MSLTQCVRKLSCYKKVPRPEEFKIISRPDYVPPSLEEHLIMRIKTGGPMSVADYMRTVVTHPKSGYYMQGDVFGKQGDFITSPEISPLFGEMIGIWACNELNKIGSPRPMQIVELGPGRGTLAADILRVLHQLPPGPHDLSLHLVEVSPRLAQIQASKLALTELTATLPPESPHFQEAITEAGLPVYWYTSIKRVPRNFSFIIAHEFFDALPIHKYQKVEGKWHEVLITTKSEQDKTVFDYILSKTPDSPFSFLIDAAETRDHVEICPEGAEIVAEIAERLEENGGLSLIVDYGHLGSNKDTFRAFKNHKLHNPLDSPGSADLTADVDFAFLRRATANKSFSVGPIEQGTFLRQVGIQTRLKMLLEKASPDQAESLKSGVKMIVEDMGKRFLFWVLFPAVLEEHLGRFPVAGFNQISS